ncbi:MAG TPA: hypothetical protein PKD54_06275, partial [Pirellulaceae bacterium]|nr:hypothetical protein [Pirellulaceae bacterium]
IAAQSAPEPSIVISLAPLNKQLKDISYLIETSGMGFAAPMFRMQAEQFLKGLDRERPHGVFLYFDRGNPEPKALAFFAVSDLSALLDNLAMFGADIDEGEVTTIVAPNGVDLFVRQSGGFAFVTDKRELLNELPSAPLAELGDLPSQYNLAAKVLVQRIPQDLRDMVIGMIEDSYAEQLDMMGNDFLADIQGQNIDYQMNQLKSLIHESKEATLGFSIDQTERRLYADMQMIGLDGSVLAKQSQGYADAPRSQFNGFLMDGATMTMVASARLQGDDVSQIAEMLSGFRNAAINQLEEESNLPPNQTALVKRVVGELFDVLDQTIREGVMDLGGAILMDDDSANFALGVHVVNPARVERAIKDVVSEFGRDLGQVADVRLDVGTHAGVNLHQIVVPIDEYSELHEFVGDQAKILLGFGNGAVYLAAGSDPERMLKSALDASAASSGDPSTPVQFNLYMGPLMKKIGQAQGEPMVEQLSNKLLENRRDRIRVTINPMANGFNYRFEMQDGILELIGVAAQAFGMGGGPDF